MLLLLGVEEVGLAAAGKGGFLTLKTRPWESSEAAFVRVYEVEGSYVSSERVGLVVFVCLSLVLRSKSREKERGEGEEGEGDG